MVKVVIAGGGFGGLDTALKLRQKDKNIDIILIDKKDYFTYKPSLHEIISNKTSSKNVKINLKKILKKQNIKFIQEEIIDVKPLEKAITTISRKIIFDYLVVALGGVTNFFNTEALHGTLELNRLNNTFKIKERLEEEFEKAKHYTEPINILIIGGGVLGVELAGELADFNNGSAKIIIEDRSSTILKGFDIKAIKYAEKILQKKGVKLQVNSGIKKIEHEKVILKEGFLYTSLIVWCGGVKPNPVARKMALRTNENGAIMINEFLQSSHPQIYSLGDCSYMYKNPQSMTALTAIQQSDIVAHNIISDTRKKDKKVYNPKESAYLISLGKGHGILVRGKKIKTGRIPHIMKKIVEKHYMFTRKHWSWPFNKWELH